MFLRLLLIYANNIKYNAFLIRSMIKYQKSKNNKVRNQRYQESVVLSKSNKAVDLLGGI